MRILKNIILSIFTLVLLLKAENKLPAGVTVSNAKAVFKYGTHQQQIDLLRMLPKKTLVYEDSPAFFDTLQILIDQSEDDGVTYILINTIHNHKVTKYYNEIPKMITETAKRSDTLPHNAVKTIAEGLRIMRAISNLIYINTFMAFYTNASLHQEEPRILAEAIYGIGSFKPKGETDNLKKIYRENLNEQVRMATLQSISEYKNPKDIDFFKNIALDEGAENVLRWTAVISLSKYEPDPEAQDVLESLLNYDNIEISSRALYALGSFKNADITSQIKKAARSSSDKLRYMAVKALEKYEDKDSNELLMYKYHHDSSPAIKKEAERILKKRGLIKEKKEDGEDED
jgi:hypothetical protein